MKNLLDSTEIGTIFLDHQLDILRYTPQVKKLFNLIPTDVGRPIIHVVSNFDYPSIETDIREVIDSLSIKEIELRTKSKDWYKVRIMPYRTLDNFISGAVLTFTLITHYKEMEYQLQALESYTSATIGTMAQAAVQLDRQLRIIAASPAFFALMDMKVRKLTGQPFLNIIQDHWKTNDAQELLKQCLETGKASSRQFNIGGPKAKQIEISAQPFINEGLQVTFFVIVMIKTV
jgi:two-component system CheB/CheR fusion protein